MVGAAACGDDSDSASSAEPPGDASGSISIEGSGTVQPVAEAAAQLIREGSPDLEVAVGAAGTSAGFEAFCEGETDISDASRPIEPHEEELCAEEGVDYAEVQVANDGIAIVTNPKLAIACMTVDQLRRLWETEEITSYGELGDDPETGEPLPDEAVSLYGAGTDSGTFDHFTEQINGEEGRSRRDYRPSEDDNVLVDGVARDPTGIGYFGFSYYDQNADGLNLVSVDDGDGCVAPSVETIQSGEYAPLSRPLFMYVSDKALRRPEVEAFMQFVVDDYGEIAETAVTVPMDDAQGAEAQSALAAAIGG